MSTISQPMTQDHRRCDDLFIGMEQALMKSDWDKAKRLAGEFTAGMRQHFSVEEERLFPALEQASGQTDGPIRVMTMEHDQMRHLMNNLLVAVEEHAKAQCLGIAETLLVTMQQHNMKEENVLYPMADRMLPESATEITAQLVEPA